MILEVRQPRRSTNPATPNLKEANDGKLSEPVHPGRWSGRQRLKAYMTPGKPGAVVRESFLIALEDAISEIYPPNKAPCVRTFREHMDRRGCIVRVGRSCYTTRASLNAYKQELQSCVDSGRSSRRSAAKRKTARSIGQRAALSPSDAPMVLSPGRRVEHSLGGNTAAARREEVDRLDAGYEERATSDPLTFSRAFMNYIEHHALPLYAEKILASLGERQCCEIDDTVMVELSRTCSDLMPRHPT